MAYRIKYSDYSTTAEGPPDPDRWVGPPGPQGPTGPTGPQGPQGVPGTPYPEAPNNGPIYGRGGATVTWTPVLPLAGGIVTGPLTVPSLNISAIPNAQPDGSPPVGAKRGDIYNNGGFVCIAP